MTTEATIEPATTDDLDAVLDLWVDLVADQRQHGTHLLAEPNRTTARDVVSQYVVTDNLLVARTRQIVGFVMFHVETGLYQEDATRGLIDNVYVTEPYRHDGIGSRLLDAAETRLRDDDVDTLAISVMADNDDARALYESRGYTPHRVLMERPAETDTNSTPDRE